MIERRRDSTIQQNVDRIVAEQNAIAEEKKVIDSTKPQNKVDDLIKLARKDVKSRE